MRLGRERKEAKRRVAFSIESQRLAMVAGVDNADGGFAIDAHDVRDLDSLEQVPGLLREVARENGLSGCETIGVLHPELYEMRMAEAPEVASHEMADAIRWLVRELVDFPPEEATIDYIEIPDNPGHHGPPRVYVVAARNDVTELTAMAAEEAGLRLVKIDIGELTLRNIAARLPGDEHGLGVVRIGRRGGRLTVTRGGHLYLSRRIEMGLDRLVGGVPHLETFGELEIEHDGTQGDANEFLEALLLEIQRSLDYYEGQFAQAPIGDLVFAPFEEPVPALLPFMEKHLSAAVSNLDVSLLGTPQLPMSTADWSRALLALGALLGIPGDAS